MLGFDDPIKISKRLHYESTKTRPVRANQAAVVRPVLRATTPAACAAAAHIGGTSFEAHIPLSQAALAKASSLAEPRR